MRSFRVLLALALFVGLVSATTSEAAPAQTKAKKGQHAIHGVVVSVHHGKNGKGTMKVAVHNHASGPGKGSQAVAGSQKGQKGQAAHVETFHFDSSTKFVRGSGGKGKGSKGSATERDLHKGEHVIIKGGPRHASEVDILGGGGGRKK